MVNVSKEKYIELNEAVLLCLPHIWNDCLNVLSVWTENTIFTCKKDVIKIEF